MIVHSWTASRRTKLCTNILIVYIRVASAIRAQQWDSRWSLPNPSDRAGGGGDTTQRIDIANQQCRAGNVRQILHPRIDRNL
ncbi:hypothetical protein BGZ61DRAFT_136380 [Ilyonectria robusta]|uniref:uncharacterized protein n=1 Tax=Ilyonectria robusta TaxID=1079257 RepID=UPI001E8D7E5C|nr:uncharacterized protein BGZ61DRAFT_136380 [Ilyonectria robusta]KAH8735176.1 hypothetical protein BGZ61DRAFT_136380 [Ilyonectria robusta]